MPTYRSDEEGMERRAAELESAKQRAQAELEVDAALAREQRERRGRAHERAAEVQAGRDRLARIFGAIAVAIGALFLAALLLVALEPGRMPYRLLLCLLTFGLVPSAWGILKLARGAGRLE